MSEHDDQERRKVVAWMAREGRGYKAAATHFGLSVARCRRYRTWGAAVGMLPRGRVASASGPSEVLEPEVVEPTLPAEVDHARPVAELDAVDAIKAELDQVEELLTQAIKNGHTASGAALIKLKHELYADLRVEKKAAGAGEELESMPRDEYETLLREEAEEMEDADLEIYIAVWLERHGIPVEELRRLAMRAVE